jgi:ABC-type dipeptide/oligopeptide/nickel transport system permease component
MARKIIGVVAGLAVWLAIALIAGFIIRATWPAYVSVAEAMAFTLPMMITRLAIGVIATIAMGFVAARITRSRVARLMPGIILLVLFIPEHVMIWDKFPIWYHLWFLTTLVPLTYLGNVIAGGAIRQRSLVAA